MRVTSLKIFRRFSPEDCAASLHLNKYLRCTVQSHGYYLLVNNPCSFLTEFSCGLAFATEKNAFHIKLITFPSGIQDICDFQMIDISNHDSVCN